MADAAIIAKLREMYGVPVVTPEADEVVVIPAAFVPTLHAIFARTKRTRELLGIVLSDEDQATVDNVIALLADPDPQGSES